MTRTMTPVPKPTPRESPLAPGQQRRKYIQQRRSRRQVDVVRRDWCRGEPCVARVGYGPCSGPIDPHHAGKKPGHGMRSGEDTVVPICRGHHDQITGRVGGYGAFQKMGRDGRRELQDGWIGETTARFMSHGNRRVA